MFVLLFVNCTVSRLKSLGAACRWDSDWSDLWFTCIATIACLAVLCFYPGNWKMGAWSDLAKGRGTALCTVLNGVYQWSKFLSPMVTHNGQNEIVRCSGFGKQELENLKVLGLAPVTLSHESNPSKHWIDQTHPFWPHGKPRRNRLGLWVETDTSEISHVSVSNKDVTHPLCRVVIQSSRWPHPTCFPETGH